MSNYAVYVRVSTKSQGVSGLGLESQRQICQNYIDSVGGTKIAEFKDVESGKSRNRKGLLAAVDFCKETGATLVIAKLDRLARDVEFTFKIRNTGIKIYFCDMPLCNTMVLGMFAAVAEYERELISMRSKNALGVIKGKNARGEVHISKAGNETTHLGREKGCKIDRKAVANSVNTRLENARENEKNKRLKLFFEDYEKDNGRIGANADYNKIAGKLNALGYTTSTGMAFTVPRLRSTLKTIRKIYYDVV